MVHLNRGFFTASWRANLTDRVNLQASNTDLEYHTCHVQHDINIYASSCTLRYSLNYQLDMRDQGASSHT